MSEPKSLVEAARNILAVFDSNEVDGSPMSELRKALEAHAKQPSPEPSPEWAMETAKKLCQEVWLTNECEDQVAAVITAHAPKQKDIGQCAYCFQKFDATNTEKGKGELLAHVRVCESNPAVLLQKENEAIAADSAPVSMDRELAEALRRLMSCQRAAERARSVSIRSVIEDKETELADAESECRALLASYDEAHK